MGWGDALMACGEAKKIHQDTGRKVKIGDKRTLFHEIEIFANNPYMCSRIDEDGVWLANYIGNRPYIKSVKNGRMVFNKDYKPIAGELFFTDKELKWADEHAPKGDLIIIEPNVKKDYKHTVNKAWYYWEDLVKHDYPFYQMGYKLENAITNHIVTEDFRKALLILSKAKLYVGTDGGLHHAAAALNIPAVVIWTGFTSPEFLGYDNHVNIWDGGEACGTISGVCPHCVRNSRNITLERVLDAVDTEWHRAQR